MARDTRLPIGGLAKRTGTKVNTIRFYEDIGLLPCAARTASGRRTYGDEDVGRLAFIRNARGTTTLSKPDEKIVKSYMPYDR